MKSQLSGESTGIMREVDKYENMRKRVRGIYTGLISASLCEKINIVKSNGFCRITEILSSERMWVV